MRYILQNKRIELDVKLKLSRRVTLMNENSMRHRIWQPFEAFT